MVAVPRPRNSQEAPLRRRDIEGRAPEEVARDILVACERFCGDTDDAATPAHARDAAGDAAG